METTYQVTIGKYTYESNPEDKAIPDFYITVTKPFTKEAIIQKVDVIPYVMQETNGYMQVPKYLADRFEQTPSVEYLPLTYSNNPFILTPTENPKP